MRYERPILVDLGSIADHTFIFGKELDLTLVDAVVEASTTPDPGDGAP